mmetsp:Transcript_34902/g.109539  ORF Transcript_34902/g.109539 Transcript_34902/m.109539 type:complete len:261 (-) Transcript_34902:86-868(-)
MCPRGVHAAEVPPTNLHHVQVVPKASTSATTAIVRKRPQTRPDVDQRRHRAPRLLNVCANAAQIPVTAPRTVADIGPAFNGEHNGPPRRINCILHRAVVGEIAVKGGIRCPAQAAAIILDVVHAPGCVLSRVNLLVHARPCESLARGRSASSVQPKLQSSGVHVVDDIRDAVGKLGWVWDLRAFPTQRPIGSRQHPAVVDVDKRIACCLQTSGNHRICYLLQVLTRPASAAKVVPRAEAQRRRQRDSAGAEHGGVGQEQH